MDPRVSIVVWLGLVSVALATLIDGDVEVTLHVDDASEQYGYWHTDVADTKMSLEFQPEEGDAKPSSGTWWATLEHRLVTPGHSPPPRRPKSLPSPAPLSSPTFSGGQDAGGSGSSEVMGFTLSLGRYTLVRLPAMNRSLAERYCADEGWRIASISRPEDLQQLRDLLTINSDDHDAKPRDAYIDVADSNGQPIRWVADEIKGSPCLAMTPAGELFLRSCELKLAFFCQQPDDPPAL